MIEGANQAPPRPPAGWAPPYPGPPVPWGWVPPRRRPKRFGWLALLGVLIGGLVMGAVGALALAALAIGLTGGFDDIQYTAGSHAALPSKGVAQVGDCLRHGAADVELGEPREVVACSSNHGAEVLGVEVAPTSKVWPGRSDLDYFVDGACAIAFHNYVGTRYDDSDLDYEAIVPSKSAWHAGDRRVWCLLDSSTYQGGRGSARGSGV